MQIFSGLLLIFAGFAAVGFIVSLVSALLVYWGVAAPSMISGALFPGLFIVWLPAVLVGTQLARHGSANDYWKEALRGTPKWLRYAIWGFWGVAALILLAAFVARAINGESALMPPVTLIVPAAFYSTALAILVSGARVGLAPRRCPIGHAVSSKDVFCRHCGRPVATDHVA